MASDKTGPQDEKDYSRLYEMAYDRARRGFGDGWFPIGKSFRRGATAVELLHIIASQAEGVSDKAVRALANALHSHLVEEDR
jgi:hypothetical protein